MRRLPRPEIPPSFSIVTSMQKLPAEMPWGGGRQCLPPSLRLGVNFLQRVQLSFNCDDRQLELIVLQRLT
jgi:hypothetical protein